MLDGRPLVDAHLHPARLPTLKAAWHSWAEQFGQPGWRSVFDSDGAVIPRVFDELMESEGADSRSASIPAAIGAPHRHLPSSNHWPMVMLFGTIAALYFAREILIPLAFALILTFVLSPVVALLEKSRIGRIPSVVVTVLVTMAAAGCVAWVIAIQLVDVAKELPRYGQNIDAKMEALRVPTKGRLGRS